MQIFTPWESDLRDKCVSTKTAFAGVLYRRTILLPEIFEENEGVTLSIELLPSRIRMFRLARPFFRCDNAYNRLSTSFYWYVVPRKYEDELLFEFLLSYIFWMKTEERRLEICIWTKRDLFYLYAQFHTTFGHVVFWVSGLQVGNNSFSFWVSNLENKHDPGVMFYHSCV